MRTRKPVTRNTARWWLIATVLCALPAVGARPGAIRYPTVGGAVLSDRPAVAWAPGELGVCACELDAPVQTPASEAGLSTELFRGNYTALPTFAAEAATESFVSPTVTIGARANDDKYALRMRGRIHVPAAGQWRFVLRADDGARLLINGTQVINIDGQRDPAAVVEGTVASLAAGRHTIEVQYFRNGLNGALELRWAGPTVTDPSAAVLGDEQVVPASAFDFLPPLSQACVAAQTRPACTSDSNCAADSFCALTDGGGVGVCQLASAAQLCIDDAACGRSSRCVTPTSVGATSSFEASIQCPANAPDCQIPGVSSAVVPGVLTEITTNITLERLPVFDDIVPTRTITTDNFTVAASNQNTDLYAYRFRGFIEIPATGTWTFTTDSDDGSKLFIDGALVVDNDGLHARREIAGVRNLSAGRHDIEVQFFERFGGDFLGVTWAGPGVAKQTIPAAVLSHLPGARVACTVASTSLSCEPSYNGRLARGTAFVAERRQIVSIRGASLSSTLERLNFSVAPRVEYVVQVAEDTQFNAGNLLYESAPLTANRLPFASPVLDSIHVRSEPVDAQTAASCGRVTIGGDSLEVLCNGSGAVTLPFNVPSTGTYAYRARVTGDQAGPDPVRVEVLLDGSVFPGVGDPQRPGIVDVTTSRGATQDIAFSTILASGRHSVNIRFVNDFCCTPGDRNLLVDFVEIQGPAEAEVLLDALSVGDVFWRVLARDGTEKSTPSSNMFLLEMDDLTPPQAPVVKYPIEGDAVLSTRPGVAWDPVSEAVDYEVRFTSVAEQRTVTARTGGLTAIDASPAGFARGDAITIEVVALDAIGNASPPSRPIRVTIAPRLRYEFEAFHSRTLSPSSLILSRNVGGSTSFGPIDQPRAPTFTARVLPTSGASTGNTCGVTGDGYVNLCGQNHTRDYSFTVPEDGSYALTVEAYQNFAAATVVGQPNNAIMQVLVDNVPVTQFEVTTPSTFGLQATLTTGVHAVSLRFTNDLCCTTGDRNLFVRAVSVTGPANLPTFTDLLSVGDVYWRVTALDAFGRAAPSNDLFKVEFPDDTPPTTPNLIYPEENATLLSARPSFVWTGTADTAEYRLEISSDAGVAYETTTSQTTIDLPTTLARGVEYTLTLTARDQRGNVSAPVVQRFTVQHRVTYDFLAASSLSFTPGSVILQRGGLTEPRFGVDGLTTGTIDVTAQVEDLEGTGCGTRFSGSSSATFQVLCNANQSRTLRVQAPAAGLYNVTVRVSADQVEGQARARLRVAGRTEQERDVVATFQTTAPATQPPPDLAEEITVPITLGAGSQSVTLSFVNEFCCSPGDRNLLLDTVRVQGPLANSALASALSRGTVYWRVTAADGVGRGSPGIRDFVVDFPDLTPPATPLLTYPFVNAAVLSQNPAFIWQPVAEAVQYRVTLVNLATGSTSVRQTSDTSFQWPDVLPRNSSYTVSITAVDSGNNASEPSTPVAFSIAPRIRYQLQAASDPGFQPADMILDRDVGGATTLGPVENIFLSSTPVSQKLRAFDFGVTGNNCGAISAGGTVFATLCDQNNSRTYAFPSLATPGEYLISIEAAGDVVSSEGALAEVSVDGSVVATISVSAAQTTPQTISFRRTLTVGPHLVTVRFTNDLCCSPADRNLYVGNASIEGPVNNNTLSSLLERGDMFWRVIATDGVRQSVGSSDTRIIGFPDRVPPVAPQQIYPEIASQVLSLSPSFVWGRVSDAVRYKLSIRDAPPPPAPGIRTDVWTNLVLDRLPDFSAMTPTTSFVGSNFVIASANQNTDHYAYRFRGLINIPTAGGWTFSTISDDGSRLYIDGVLVVDNDGLHGSREITGQIPLSGGPHAIEVQYFERTGGDSLNVTWAGPGVTKQTIPPNVLTYDTGVAGALVAERSIVGSTTYDLDVPLVRGNAYTWEIAAVDRAGNESVAVRTGFSIARRLRYSFEAASSPTFSDASIFLRRDDYLGTSINLADSVSESVSTVLELEGGEGVSCGTTRTGNLTFANVCSNGVRLNSLRVPSAGTYNLTIRWSGTQTLPIAQFGAVEAIVEVDGSPIGGTQQIASQFPESEVFTVQADLRSGLHTIGVRFINDFCCSPADRNLLVDSIVVEGPVGNSSLNDLLSRGPVYWRVSALDENNVERKAERDYVVDFPDRFPPGTPQLKYPAPGAAILSVRPSFAWTTATDATRYRVVVQDLDGNQEFSLGETSSTTIDWPLATAPLSREGNYRVTVFAIDAAGNLSVQNVPVAFTVTPRLHYELQVATSRTFEPSSILLERFNLEETTLTTSGPINPVVNDRRETEGALMSLRNHCGVSGGYVNLCGSGSSVGATYNILGARETYEVSFRAYSPFVGAELARVAVLVDGVVVDTVNIGGFVGGVGQSAASPAIFKRSLDLTPGERQISLRFENDFCCLVGDRNVFVDFIQLTGPVGLSGQTIEQALKVGPVFWRVAAVDAAAKSTMSTELNLVEFPDQTPPDAPIPVYPEDSGRILSLSPGFTWTPVDDAASYRVVVVDQSTELEIAATSVPAPSTHIDGTTLGIRLERGRVYRWFVEAVDQAGNRSPDSPRRLFEVDKRISYTVELASDVRFRPGDVVLTQQLADLTQTQIRSIDLPDVGETYYRVIARDGTRRETISAPVHVVDLPDTKPPLIVRVLYPDSGDEVLDSTPGFAWAEQEPGLEYEFEISTTENYLPGTTLFSSRARGSSIELPDDAALQPNNLYYWRVRAIDALENVGEYGLSRTIALRRKTAPVYTFELATRSFHLNPTPVFTGSTAQPELTLPPNRPLAQGNTYFWRVRADLTIESEPPTVKTRYSNDVQTFETGQFVPEPGGVIGVYFRDRTFSQPSGQRLDGRIDFPALADGNPFGDFGGLTGTNGDEFSVRWTGLVFAPQTGQYTFAGVADDTQLLVVADTTVFNQNQYLGPARREGTILLQEGWHTFVYEMSEGSASAFAQLMYRCETCSPAIAEQVIPSEYLAVPRDNTDTRAPEFVRTFISSAMPATATTPARVTLQVETNEPTRIDVTIFRDSQPNLQINGLATRLLHEIPLGDLRGAFQYSLVATDLNNNSVSLAPTPACAPTEADLIPASVRATFFSETNLTGRVLDELQSNIDYSEPSAAARRLVGTTEYSIRFNGGFFVPPSEVPVGQTTRNFQFVSLADDGQRLSVNGAVVQNDMVRRSGTLQRPTVVALGPGWNEITFDLLQGQGNARARLTVAPQGFEPSLIPATRLAAVNQSYLRPRFAAGAETMVIEAQTPQGSAASLAVPAVLDCRDPAPRLTSNSPSVFPLGTTNVAWTARNRFNEVGTLVQTVIVRDTTAPSIRPLPDMTLQCVSPQQDGLTESSLLTLPTVRVTDNADLTPTVRFVLPTNFVLDQPTPVSVVARDSSGNQSTVEFNVTTVDTAPLQVVVDPQLTVARADDCTRSDGSLGTRVTLPTPRVGNLCLASQEQNVAYTHNVSGSSPTDPSVCLPAGTSVATWTGRLGSRLGQASVRVTVVNSAFDVTTVSAPSGYVRTDSEVHLQLTCRNGGTGCFAVFDAGGVRRIQWRVDGARQPNDTVIGDDGSFIARFTDDVVACPLNVVVIDAVGRQGVSGGVCFAIDRTAPTVETGDVPTTFFAKDDFTEQVTADIANPDTWPHVFTGENPSLTIGASDALGTVDSGIRSVSVVLRSLDAPTPPVTLFEASPAAGTDPLRSGPIALQQVCVSPVCVDGQLDLARLDLGAWSIQVQASDMAGNTVSAERPFRVLDMTGALDTVFTASPTTSGWLSETNVNRLTANSTFKEQANRARKSIVRAGQFITESPSTTTLELFKAVDALSRPGLVLNTTVVRQYVSRAVRSEVRRIVELHSVAPFAGQAWDQFGSGRYTNFNNPVGAYRGRPHIVSAPQVLTRVRNTLAFADNEHSLNRPNEGVLYAGEALDELAILMDDGILAAFYGRQPHLIEPPSQAFPAGRAERYFLNAFSTNVDSDYGRELALVVEQSISRLAAAGVKPDSLVVSSVRESTTCTTTAQCDTGEACMDGYCLEICVDREDCDTEGDVCLEGLCYAPGPFSRVADRIEIFREGVDALDCRLDPACSGRKLQTNLEFLNEIYMNVQDSFVDLADVQEAAFSTHSWRQGIALTLQYLLNFTIYTGQRPLIVLAPTDPTTVMTECWWHRMNEALNGGSAAGVDQALDLFESGRCLNVDIYNKFYGGEQELRGDLCVDPAEYGCPSDGARHAGGGCLRVDPELLPTLSSMCGPLR
jgi:hypothetical protein